MSDIAVSAPIRQPRVAEEGLLTRWILIGVSVAFLALVMFLPLVAVVAQALGRGLASYIEALTAPDAVAAIELTLTVSFFCVVFNILVGVCAAWAIAKFHFRGRQLLLTLINLPF